jgi:hypothetical protein
MGCLWCPNQAISRTIRWYVLGPQLFSEAIRISHTYTHPQNWPRWLKWVVLLQVSFMAFLGPFNAAVPNPSFVLLGEAFHRPVEIITYSTTTAIISGGVAVRAPP